MNFMFHFKKSMALLLSPLAKCCSKLNLNVVKPIIDEAMNKVQSLLLNLTNDHLREKRIDVAFKCLESCKILAPRFFPGKDDEVDNIRLRLVLKMLKSIHFNAKMNALREVCF